MTREALIEAILLEAVTSREALQAKILGGDSNAPGWEFTNTPVSRVSRKSYDAEKFPVHAWIFGPEGTERMSVEARYARAAAKEGKYLDWSRSRFGGAKNIEDVAKLHRQRVTTSQKRKAQRLAFSKPGAQRDVEELGRIIRAKSTREANKRLVTLLARKYPDEQ